MATEPPTGLESITVACGDNRAIFDPSSWKVTFKGEEMTPTEFERRSGRAAAKKWKVSIRVVTNGQEQGPVGAWLEAHGLVPVGQKRVAPPDAVREREPGMRRRAPRKIADYIHEEEEVDKTHKSRITPAAILAHLDKQNLGFRPGDPTVGELPQTCGSRADQGGGPALMEVDLRSFPEDQLRQMCQDSAESPLGDLLDVQPGVERHRLAYFTGRQPKRKAISLDKLDSKVLWDYVDGRGELPPYVKLPMVAGKEVNLRWLWSEVQKVGGYVECSTSKLWAATAAKIGIDCSTSNSAGSQLRKVYLGILLEKERTQPVAPGSLEPSQGPRETDRASPAARGSREPPQPPIKKERASPAAADGRKPSLPPRGSMEPPPRQRSRSKTPTPAQGKPTREPSQPPRSSMEPTTRRLRSNTPTPAPKEPAREDNTGAMSASLASLLTTKSDPNMPRLTVSGNPMNIVMGTGSGGKSPWLEGNGRGPGATLGNGGGLASLLGGKRRWSGEVARQDGGGSSIPGLD